MVRILTLILILTGILTSNSKGKLDFIIEKKGFYINNVFFRYSDTLELAEFNKIIHQHPTKKKKDEEKNVHYFYGESRISVKCIAKGNREVIKKILFHINPDPDNSGEFKVKEASLCNIFFFKHNITINTKMDEMKKDTQFNSVFKWDNGVIADYIVSERGGTDMISIFFNSGDSSVANISLPCSIAFDLNNGKEYLPQY